MNTQPNTDQKHKVAFNQRVAQLKDNPVLFMPMEALARYIDLPNGDTKEALQKSLLSLANFHPFVGGLIFEIEGNLKETFGVDSNSLKIIKEFMNSHGFNLGELSTYDRRTDLVKVMETPLSKTHGTARRDKYRENLNKMLSAGYSINEDETLIISRSASIDGHGYLKATFNLSATLKQEVDNADLDAKDLTKAINGTLKRIVRRAFLKENNIDIPTDVAAQKYDSQHATIIEMNNGIINVEIPLKRTVNGNFQDKILTSEHVDEDLAKEVIHGIKIAIAMKNRPV